MAYPEIRPADPGEAGVRALYESAGFTSCAPFADYVAGENSVYLTLPLIG